MNRRSGDGPRLKTNNANVFCTSLPSLSPVAFAGLRIDFGRTRRAVERPRY